MKTIQLFIYLLLLSTAAMASPVTLKGKVTNKISKEPIIGATVYLPDLKTGTVTALDGTFTIDNLPSIKTLVQIKELGFKTFIQVIDLSANNLLEITMEESVVEENEVVITGTSKSTEIKRSPVPIIPISHEFLQENNSTNAIDALAKVPGVNTLTTGPNVSKPYIHGLGYNRVLTLYDGMRQEGQQWGDEHGVEIDQYLIDRIEVVKGPASLIYGSDALAGVVNLLPANPLPLNSIKGEVLSNYQTNNNLLASSLALAGNNNGWIWDGRFTQRAAADYQNRYDGRVYGTKFNETDFNARLGLNRAWGYSYLNFSLYDDAQEIPDGSRDSASRKFTRPLTDSTSQIVSDKDLKSYKIGVIHQRVQHYRFFSSSSFIVGDGKIDLGLGYQRSIRREYDDPTAPDVAGLYLILNTMTYDLKYHLPEKRGFETTVGFNGMYQVNNTDNATEYVIPDYSLFDFGPFACVKKNLGKWDFLAGVRYDIRKFNNQALYVPADTAKGEIPAQFNSYSHIFSGFSGSFGLTYNITDNFGLKANIARGFRAPNIAEISANGIHPGTGFLQLGDDNLKPEFNLQEDIGMYFESKHVSVTAEIFYNDIQNYIYNEKLLSANGGDSTVSQHGSDFPVFKFRQTEATLFGGEIRVDIHPHPLDWLHFENSLSIINAINRGGNGARITDSTKYLPFIPPFHTNSELRAEIRKQAGRFSHIFVKVGLQYYAAQNQAFLAYGTETKTPGYTLLDAGFGADILSKKGRTLFNFSVLGTNLADVAYQSNMSRLKYMDNYPQNYTGRSGIYNMGRNISFRLIIPIDIKKA